MRVAFVTPLVVLLSLVLSLLPFHTSAQDVLPPTMVSATLDPPGQAVSIIFTSPTLNCPFYCWFNLYHDTNDSSSLIDTFPLSTVESTYYATVNVNNSAIPNGKHMFFATQSSIPYTDSPWSNMVHVMVKQPQANAEGNVVTTPSSIAGDPQFTGLRGQTYQVHGVPDEVFSIVSDVDLQYNSRFVLLKEGSCPNQQGKSVDTPCFTHPGTYLGELGLETTAGDRIYIQAGSATSGFQQITLNDRELQPGDHHVLKALPGRTQGYVRLISTHRVIVQAGNFWFEFTNSDMFVNQRVAMIDAKQETSHGLLGQTWSTVIYDASSTIPWIEGSVFDYAMADHQLFSHRFIFNRFQSAATETEDVAEAEDEDDAEEEEAELLKRLQRITAARARATGKSSASKKAHTHAHRSEWDL